MKTTIDVPQTCEVCGEKFVEDEVIVIQIYVRIHRDEKTDKLVLEPEPLDVVVSCQLCDIG